MKSQILLFKHQKSVILGVFIESDNLTFPDAIFLLIMDVHNSLVYNILLYRNLMFLSL